MVGSGTIDAVREFFESGRMLKQFNATTISLILKVVGADQLS